MKIVDYRPPKRIRKLTARNFSWRKDGPAHAFSSSASCRNSSPRRSTRPTDAFHFMGGTLCDGSLRFMAAEVRRLARDSERLAHQDAALPLEVRDGCSAVFAIRKWEFREFTKLRR